MDDTPREDEMSRDAASVGEGLNAGQSYTGTELDPALDVDFDLDDWDDEDNGTMRLVGMAAGAAALVAVALLLGRRKPKKQGLEAVADEVGQRAAAGAKGVQKAVERADLSNIDVADLLDELRQRTQQLQLDREVNDAVRAARRRARTVVREGRRAADEFDPRDLRRGADRVGRAARQRLDDFDPSDAQGVMEQFSDRVVGAIDRLRSDLAPAVSSTAAAAAVTVDDNLPKARDAARAAAENLQNLFRQGRRQGARLAEQAAPAVQRGGDMGGQFGELIKVVAMEVVGRILSDVVPQMQKRGEQVAGRVKDDTVPFVQHRAADVADVVRGDVAPRLRKLAEDAPERVRGAMDTARPVVTDAAHNVAETAQTAASATRSAVDTGRARVGETAEEVREGLGGRVGSARARAGALVQGTKQTTGYLTKESSSLFFWLAMLGAMIMFIFVPDRERQAAMWQTFSQFMGELRIMWSDFQGDDFPDATADEFTGDQA